MYEYKFVTLKVSTWDGRIKEDYREVIQQHAKDGWRLKETFFHPLIHPNTMEIIFEKEASS